MIIGQDKAINYLNKIIAEGAAGASFIFLGPEGVGKKTTARWFAKKINCASEKKSPCGVCSSCVKINKNIHPDVVHIKPDGNYIKIEQTRAIVDGAVFRPFEGKYKVYILEDAHVLTNAAANQMLKILEEPPEYLVIILIISDASNLPPTVMSRCRRVPFNYVAENLIRDYVKAEYDLEDAKINAMAKLSGGSIGRAAGFVADKHFWRVRDFSLSLGAKLNGTNYAEALKEAEKTEGFKEYQELVLDFLTGWFRDLMILKETKNADMVVNHDVKDALNKSAGEYSVWQIKKSIRHILEAKKLLRRNVNKKIIFNNLFLKLVK